MQLHFMFHISQTMSFQMFNKLTILYKKSQNYLHERLKCWQFDPLIFCKNWQILPKVAAWIEKIICVGPVSDWAFVVTEWLFSRKPTKNFSWISVLTAVDMCRDQDQWYSHCHTGHCPTLGVTHLPTMGTKTKHNPHASLLCIQVQFSNFKYLVSFYIFLSLLKKHRKQAEIQFATC